MYYIYKAFLTKQSCIAIYSRFGEAGEVAVDLVRRLLMFDWNLRCGPDEALFHEYFNVRWYVVSSYYKSSLSIM